TQNYCLRCQVISIPGEVSRKHKDSVPVVKKRTYMYHKLYRDGYCKVRNYSILAFLRELREQLVDHEEAHVPDNCNWTSSWHAKSTIMFASTLPEEEEDGDVYDTDESEDDDDDEDMVRRLNANALDTMTISCNPVSYMKSKNEIADISRLPRSSGS
ncbi:hypothetical protein C5167_004220, partial [Papaver somniferum]